MHISFHLEVTICSTYGPLALTDLSYIHLCPHDY